MIRNLRLIRNKLSTPVCLTRAAIAFLFLALGGLWAGLAVSCHSVTSGQVGDGDVTLYHDTAFWQEFHVPYPVSVLPDENEVRSIAIDDKDNVWIATRSGVFVKGNNEATWKAVLHDNDQGPAFSVERGADGGIWISTWNGVYHHINGRLEKVPGPEAPVATFAVAKNGIYAAGPHGVWFSSGSRWETVTNRIGRSVRDAVVDTADGLWVSTDVGLYFLTKDSIDHFYTPDILPSAYVRGVCFDATGRLWAAGLGGVAVLDKGRRAKILTPADGLPSVQVNTVKRGPDDRMWVGTDVGVVRFDSHFNPGLLFSRRWLMDDRINDIAFDSRGNAWIATARGVSAIKRKRMTLESKAAYFQDVLLRRHIRDPWIAGQCKLPVPGDTTSWLPDDDDNDGEYTGNYLAMESFRYAVTKDPEARENARKAFHFLKLLQEVTGTDGFFARTIVPSDWTEVDDANRQYSEKQLADELIKEPRFKPVAKRWHRSRDGKWLWKGDTSSDEMGGHMMGYFFYYEHAADETERTEIRRQVARIVDHLMKNEYNLVDVDNKPTRWGVWSPELLNNDPEWMPDRNLNSMELLSFVKLAAYVTGDQRYEDAYRKLIHEHGYLENMGKIAQQNPGWFIYFDVMLAAYQYPILLRCEKDPELLSAYEDHIDSWFQRYKKDKNPLINFLYSYSRNVKAEVTSSVNFLKDTPLDLVDWPIDHRKREDVRIVRKPVMDDIQIDQLPPASIRGTIRWDKNPYGAVSGNPSVEREPVFWLFPYWMGRYLGMISPPPAEPR